MLVLVLRKQCVWHQLFLGALVVSRVLGRQDRFPRCVTVPCWSRSRHGVQGRWPAADTRESRVHRDDTHRDSGRPAHAAHARSWRDRSSRTRSSRGRTSSSAPRGGWPFRPASRDTALVSAQNQRRPPSYAVRLQTRSRRSCFHWSAFASARRPGRERARAPGTVKTSWATRRVKHAHHKTSRRRRRSGEDLGHPADERCGGLA